MKSLSIISSRARSAFSLVEVVVAVGVFAIAIVSVIGILAGVGKSVTEVSDADKAARLVSVVQARLQEAGFTAIKKAIDEKTSFFASEDGAIVGLTGDSKWGGKDALKYFELTLIRNEALSPPKAVGPGADPDDSAGFLAFNIRLSWPAYLPDGTAIGDKTQQEVMIIPAAITR